MTLPVVLHLSYPDLPNRTGNRGSLRNADVNLFDLDGNLITHVFYLGIA